MMTVGKLIEALKEYPADMPVALSSDAEGNHFKRLDEVDAMYLDLDEMDRVWSYDDNDEAIEQEPNIAIIWPI